MDAGQKKRLFLKVAPQLTVLTTYLFLHPSRHAVILTNEITAEMGTKWTAFQ